VCCSVLQCIAVHFSALQCIAVRCSVLQCVAVCCSVLQCVAVCCSVSQCVAVCCSVLQCVAVCRSVSQCVAVCCSVLPCVAVASTLDLPQTSRANSVKLHTYPQQKYTNCHLKIASAASSGVSRYVSFPISLGRWPSLKRQTRSKKVHDLPSRDSLRSRWSNSLLFLPSFFGEMAAFEKTKLLKEGTQIAAISR